MFFYRLIFGLMSSVIKIVTRKKDRFELEEAYLDACNDELINACPEARRIRTAYLNT